MLELEKSNTEQDLETHQPWEFSVTGFGFAKQTRPVPHTPATPQYLCSELSWKVAMAITSKLTMQHLILLLFNMLSISQVLNLYQLGGS